MIEVALLAGPAPPHAMSSHSQETPTPFRLLTPWFPWVLVMLAPLTLSAATYPFAPGLRSRPHLLLLGGLALAFLAMASGCLTATKRRSVQRYAVLVVALFIAAVQRTLAPNELAGILVLLIPAAVVTAIAPAPKGTPGRGTRRFQGVLLTLLLGGSLLHGQSRSGLGALALVLGPLLFALGGRGRRVFTAGLVMALLLLPVVGIDSLLELMIYDEKIQRLDVFSFLTGRPHIWQRAVLALEDFGALGAGLATGGPLTAAVYPYSRLAHGVAFEDVHNLYLQSALDLGIPGASAFLGLLGLAAVRLGRSWRQNTEDSDRAWILGLAGGLTAHLLFSVFDSVALGSPGSLVLWLILGLAGSTGVDTTVTTSRAVARSTALAAMTLATVSVLWSLTVAPLPTPKQNQLALEAAQAILTEPAEAASTREHLVQDGAERPGLLWMSGLLAAIAGDVDARDEDWQALLAQTPRYVELIETEALGNLDLARRATTLQPTDPAAHRYLARALATSHQREAAVAQYRHALALDPSNGRGWLELGDLLYEHQPRAALDAWIEVCERGDYRGQGCLRAGGLALQLDDVEEAIVYYRKSRMPGSRQYGDFLAQQRDAGRPIDRP